MSNSEGIWEFISDIFTVPSKLMRAANLLRCRPSSTIVNVWASSVKIRHQQNMNKLNWKLNISLCTFHPSLSFNEFYSCNDEEKWQKFEVNLPDFSINQVPKDRIAEFHFLELNLHDENEKAKKYKGPEEDSGKVDPHNAEWDFEPYWKEKQQ